MLLLLHDILSLQCSHHCSIPAEPGADECVDYKKDRFEQLYANDPFDVVLDLVGGKPCGAVVELVSTLLHVSQLHEVIGFFGGRWLQIPSSQGKLLMLQCCLQVHR